MSFEMRYDKNGNPIVDKNIKFEEAQPEPIAQEMEQSMQAVESLQNDQNEQETTLNSDQSAEENLQQVTQEISTETEEVEQKPIKVSKVNEENIRSLREKANKLQKERDEAMRLAEDMYKKYNQPQQQQPKVESDDEDFKVNPDELIEGKHLSKLEKKYQKKIAELDNKLKQIEQTATQTAVEAQIKAAYPDFEKVVNPETINALRESYPELAESINYNPNFYSKASAAYKAIKKMGIYQEDLYERDRAIAQKNAAKPKPVNSVAPQSGNSPLSKANAFANGLTEELADQLRQEMYEARKRI